MAVSVTVDIEEKRFQEVFAGEKSLQGSKKQDRNSSAPVIGGNL
jgi:hypothetical protein